MPVKISGDETELRFFREAVKGIKNQTDNDWILIMIDDYSESLSLAMNISKEKKLEYIDLLHCEPEYKARMKAMVS